MQFTFCSPNGRILSVVSRQVYCSLWLRHQVANDKQEVIRNTQQKNKTTDHDENVILSLNSAEIVEFFSFYYK